MTICWASANSPSALATCARLSPAPKPTFTCTSKSGSKLRGSSVRGSSLIDASTSCVSLSRPSRRIAFTSGTIAISAKVRAINSSRSFAASLANSAPRAVWEYAFIASELSVETGRMPVRSCRTLSMYSVSDKPPDNDSGWLSVLTASCSVTRMTWPILFSMRSFIDPIADTFT